VEVLPSFPFVFFVLVRHKITSCEIQTRKNTEPLREDKTREAEKLFYLIPRLIVRVNTLKVQPESKEVAIAQGAGEESVADLYPIERANAKASPLMPYELHRKPFATKPPKGPLQEGVGSVSEAV